MPLTEEKLSEMLEANNARLFSEFDKRERLQREREERERKEERENLKKDLGIGALRGQVTALSGQVVALRREAGSSSGGGQEEVGRRGKQRNAANGRETGARADVYDGTFLLPLNPPLVNRIQKLLGMYGVSAKIVEYVAKRRVERICILDPSPASPVAILTGIIEWAVGNKRVCPQEWKLVSANENKLLLEGVHELIGGSEKRDVLQLCSETRSKVTQFMNKDIKDRIEKKYYGGKSTLEEMTAKYVDLNLPWEGAPRHDRDRFGCTEFLFDPPEGDEAPFDFPAERLMEIVNELSRKYGLPGTKELLAYVAASTIGLKARPRAAQAKEDEECAELEPILEWKLPDHQELLVDMRAILAWMGNPAFCPSTDERILQHQRETAEKNEEPELAGDEPSQPKKKRRKINRDALSAIPADAPRINYT